MTAACARRKARQAPIRLGSILRFICEVYHLKVAYTTFDLATNVAYTY
jgi:hypothetical protein